MKKQRECRQPADNFDIPGDCDGPEGEFQDCQPAALSPSQPAEAELLSRTCPVIRHARKTVKLSNDLAKEMRRLRRDLLRCSRCRLNLDGTGCLTLAMFDATVQEALQEINEEWDMS